LTTSGRIQLKAADIPFSLEFIFRIADGGDSKPTLRNGARCILTLMFAGGAFGQPQADVQAANACFDRGPAKGMKGNMDAALAELNGPSRSANSMEPLPTFNCAVELGSQPLDHPLLKVNCWDCPSGVFAPQFQADSVHECSIGILRRTKRIISPQAQAC
jgi:hypothetical protein